MAIKIGHAAIDERGKASGGNAGDQTGGEICTRSWYSSPWDVVLRPKSAELAEAQAKAMEAACANKHIGYDQYQRNTLYKYAKEEKFDLGKITADCECDCSSLIHVCAIAGGAKLSYGSNGFWTGNMVDGIMASGQYEKLTEAKYLTSDAYLRRGDILIRTSGHTAMALENGAMEKGKKITAVCTLHLLHKGDEGEDVRALQILLNGRGFNCGKTDGEFGAKTRAAVLKAQKAYHLEEDGEAGSYTITALMLGG